MAFRHVSNDNTKSPQAANRIHLLELQLSRAAAEGCSVIELRRQNGRSGYVATEHRWEDDGDGDNVSDDDGAVLLIGGVPPGDLAEEIFETARAHVEETGERKNYRVVASRQSEGENGEDEEEQIFSFPLPASCWTVGSDGPSLGSERGGDYEVLLAANNQLQRQNEALFRMLMDVVRQYPTILTKSTELLEQLGDQLGGGRKEDLTQILSILHFERDREEAWMHHDSAKQRAEHRSRMADQAITLAGPDLMALLREIVDNVFSKKDKDDKDDKDDPTAEKEEKSQAKRKSRSDSHKSGLAHRLNEILSPLSAEAITKAKAALSQDDWSLIEAARKSSSDEEFKAIFVRLSDSWAAQDRAQVAALISNLTSAVGARAAMDLSQLIKESKS